MEYYLAMKKNKVMPFSAIWTDPEITILSKVSQRQISYDVTYMWNLKRWYTWAYLQNRKRATDVENTLMVTKGEKGGGINWKAEIDI